jgi:parvulin-like peptidyl-prolyl isomerase
MWMALFVILTGMPPVAAVEKPADASAVAARVNGEAILMMDVDAILKKYPSAAGPLTASQAKQLRREVLQDLIDDLLVQQFMKIHGPKVEATEIDKLWLGLAESLKKQGKTLPEYLKENRITEARAKEQWRQNLQFQKWVESQMKEAELQAYFAKYQPFFERASVRVSQIVVRVTPDAPAGERAIAKAKIIEIRNDVLAGKLLFAEAAKKHSIDPSASTGGDMGYIAQRDTIVEPAVAEAAFSQALNSLSEPLETRQGWHLVWVTGKKPGTPTTLAKSLDLVRECFAEDLRQSLVADLRKKATITENP